MDGINKRNSDASNSSSYLRSVSNETKDRFDKLLKNALQQTRNTKTCKRNNIREPDEEIELDVIKTNQNKYKENFILEKFLSDAVNLNDNITFIKPPVPLPRRTQYRDQQTSKANSIDFVLQSTVSSNVDDIKSFVDADNASNSSKATYNLETKSRTDTEQEIPRIQSEATSSSQKSANLVGDIIIHNNSLVNKIVIIKDNRSKFLDKQSTESEQETSDREDTAELQITETEFEDYQITNVQSNPFNKIVTTVGDQKSESHNEILTTLEEEISDEDDIEESDDCQIAFIQSNPINQIVTIARNKKSKAINKILTKLEQEVSDEEDIKESADCQIAYIQSNTINKIVTVARDKKSNAINKILTKLEQEVSDEENIEESEDCQIAYIQSNLNNKIVTIARDKKSKAINKILTQLKQKVSDKEDTEELENCRISYIQSNSPNKRETTVGDQKSKSANKVSTKLEQQVCDEELQITETESEDYQINNIQSNPINKTVRVQKSKFADKILAKLEQVSDKEETAVLKIIDPKLKNKSVQKNRGKKLNKYTKTETQTEPITINNIGIVIHKTDYLKLNYFIKHPCVKVHIVDSLKGEYLKKSSKARSTIGDNTDYIIPLMTKAYNLQENRSIVPYWEELLIFNENFDYLLQHKDSVIIFFEILDFLSYSVANKHYQKEGSSCGWYQIAWAFLKPVTKNNHWNIERTVRLQMYKPKKQLKHASNECILYDWWSSGNFVKYPSTLYVHIKKIEQLDNIDNNRDLNSLDQENSSEESIRNNNDSDEGMKPTRMTLQLCKIPNKIYAKLNDGIKGCLIVKFSNNGLLLACGTFDGLTYPIIIFTVSTKMFYCKLLGHQGLIYDLHWSNNDNYLISASADCTVFVWNVGKKYFRPIQVLPHPSYVYCAQMNHTQSLIATGCYDQTIRIWKSIRIDSDYELIQELYDHSGYVTSLCFGNDESVLYSSDSTGTVIQWTINGQDWILQKIMKFRELHNTIINKIILHPKNNKLLICSRDSIYRMVDLNIVCIVQWFRGALNHRMQLTACISPCGSLIFGPSEDGTICIWDAYTGILQATFIPNSDNGSRIPICIQYHPFHHIVAVSYNGSIEPIVLCIFDQICTGVELHLQHFIELEDVYNQTSQHLNKVKLISRSKVLNVKGKHVNLEFIVKKIDEVLISARNE